jgi:hypothetical protein
VGTSGDDAARGRGGRLSGVSSTYIISLVLFGLGTVAGLGSGFLFAFGRRPKGAGQVAQPEGHESITPATTA